jgi:hypothetical protein
MRSDQLTRRQCEVLKEQIRRQLSYLNHLQARMIKRRFVQGDPLLQRVIDARAAMHNLHIELHYLSCDGGVGRLPRQRDDEAESERHQRHAD